jgi:hypothetical protein
LLVDPAALAGRSTLRVEVGTAFVDDDVSWTPNDPSAPVARGQIGALAMPMVGVVIPIGDWLIGAGAMTSAVSDRSLTRPQIPPQAFGAQFQYRYAGLGGGVRRDTVTAGAARRLGDEVAVGFAVGVSRVLVAETRDVWAGFSGIHPPGDPRDDLTLALTGEDDFTPSAVGSLILAPEDTALELAVSVSYEAAAHLSGGLDTATTAGGPVATTHTPTVRMDLPQPWTIRTGARYAGERWIAEVDGDLWVFPSRAKDEDWTLTGVSVTARGLTVAMPSVVSRLAPQTHGAVRGALDVALIPGFLWATAGYAYTTQGTPEARLSPTFADLGGHTVALGLEANAGGYTVTLGASRTWSVATRRESSELAIDNPFNAGTAMIPNGIYDGTIDQVGVMVDAEIGGAK